MVALSRCKSENNYRSAARKGLKELSIQRYSSDASCTHKMHLNESQSSIQGDEMMTQRLLQFHDYPPHMTDGV